MTIIKVENCYSWLQTDNEKVKKIIWQSLRFREKGYFHSSLYRRKLWDGFTEFFKLESGRFLTGLLQHVIAALKELKEPFTLDDRRNELKFAVNEVDKNFMNQWLPKSKKPVELYDYQVDLINQAIKYRRGTIKAATGAGKSLIVLGILKCLPPKTPTLIVASQKSLVSQIYKDMEEWQFNNIGKLTGTCKDPNIITCTTLRSLNKLESILPKIKVLIVDEVHHQMMAKDAKKYYNKLKSCSVRIAVSATPFKFGEKDKSQKYSVMGYFGPPFKSKSADGELTTKKLQDRETLSKSICTFYPIEEPILQHEIYLDAVTKGIAENLHFHKIVTRLACSLKGRTLIFVERIVHGEFLAKMIPGSFWVYGEDDEKTRQAIIEKLKSANECIAIASHGIFNAGINVFCSNIVNAAGGQAEHQIIQRIGRGLRIAEDKDILNYYDFIFKNNEYLHTHSKRRVKILKDEGHEVVVKNEIDF